MHVKPLRHPRRRARRIQVMLVFALVVLQAGFQAGFQTRAQDNQSPADTADHVVEIAFATNRTANHTNDVTRIFGNEPGPLSFGFCRVEFSPIKLLKDAARHIPIRFPTESEQIIDLQRLEAAEFWPLVEHAAEGKRMLFYIHGYKMDFDKSCRRAALLQREVGPGAAVLLFAWPSQDNFAMYTRDETEIRKSVDPIKAVLRKMTATVGNGLTHVVGHSIGTRGVADAVAELADQEQLKFDELVLIAPDMDKHQFEDNLPALRETVAGMTIYASENDGPLRISREVHGEPRIGEAGEYLTLFDGVETIDITQAPRRDIYGHNYHYFNSRVIQDLEQLLIEGRRAARRPGLTPLTHDEMTYWRMTP